MDSNNLLLTTTRLMTTKMLDTLAHNSSNLNKTLRLGAGSSEDYIGYSNISTGDSSDGESAFRYWAFILLLFPLCTITGNVLVVLSVFREKYLQTCTNFFVVSLAISDLVIASLVMPFAVYYEITQKWYMSNFLCDAWVATDVMGSTASILNLVSIAIDRYIAVQYPLKYAQHKNSSRIHLTIAFVWILSILIGLPMILGMNETDSRNANECAFNNGTFLIYSSIFSFYFPTLIMIILYYKIFAKIRARAKASNMNQPKSVKLAPVKPIKFSKKPSGKVNNAVDAQEALIEKKENESPLKQVVENEKLVCKDVAVINDAKKKKKMSLINKTVQKMHHVTTPMSAASKKEKKITKTLAIVVIVYLVCWSPFFAINNLTVAVCKQMNYECKFITNELVSFLTWLGYLNSLLNPIIYTTFNIEFRRAFAKILRDVVGTCKRN